MFDQEKFDSLTEIQRCMEEAGQITRRAKITPQDQMRFNHLQQKVSLLKAGMAPDDYRRKQMQDPSTAEIFRPVEIRKEPSVEAKAYIDFLRNGIGNRRMRVVNGQPEMRAQLAGQAAITASTGSAGGYFVPVGFYGGKLFQAQKQYDALFDPNVATQISTDTSAPLLISSSDDVENPALILTESSGDSSSDIAIGQINLGGYSFRTPKLIFSREFDEDSFWPIAMLLEKSAATRLSIGVSKYLVTGNGIGQPTGIVTACEAAGAIVPAGNPTTLAYSDLENLFFSVNAAYRTNGTWLVNDNTLQKIRSLTDNNNRPLLDITSDGLTLFGRPVRLSPSLDNVGVSTYPIIFGDLSYFVVRRVTGGEYALIYNQSENLVERGLAAARYFARYDSDLICPGSGSPVSILRMHS